MTRCREDYDEDVDTVPRRTARSHPASGHLRHLRRTRYRPA
ncbi:hypothetical protein ACR6C2_04175 [Streptomyces sp. INA 01156]